MLPPAIARVAFDAGIRDLSALTAAVAIALAESGGNERAHNATPPDDSYGLWQINMLGALGPERRSRFNISTNEALYDPLTNAKAMVSISSGGTNFKPWTTYKGLRYTAFLPVASLAAQSAMVAGGVSAANEAAHEAVQGPIEAAQGAVELGLKAGAWVSNRQNWTRVAFVVAGLALVVGGVMAATRPLASSVVGGVVQTAVPVGKLLKGAKK
jgi:hypothetical protein